jgi:hypothetical protein
MALAVLVSIRSSVDTPPEERCLWKRIHPLFVQVLVGVYLALKMAGRALDRFVVRNWQWHPRVSASVGDRIVNPSRLERSSVWSSLARSRTGRLASLSSKDEGLDARTRSWA